MNSHSPENPQHNAQLISPEGEAFLARNSGIRTAITVGLGQFRARVLGDIAAFSLDLGDNRHIRHISSGQSDVFLLTTPYDASVVKTKNPHIAESESRFQPYINELLQVQAMSRDLADDFARLHVALPTFLFASSQMACVRFESGRQPTVTEVGTRYDAFVKVAQDYIDQQKNAGNTLWDNVFLDEMPKERKFAKTDNFILKPDGQLVWIDPFQYVPELTLDQQLMMLAQEGDPFAADILQQLQEMGKAY